MSYADRVTATEERRARVLVLMDEQAETNSPMTASAVARILGIPRSTASQDLSVLYAHGKVRRFREWRGAGGYTWVGM